MNALDTFISCRKELPPDNPLSELAERNRRLITELAEASVILENMATLSAQIHALFAARPRDPLKSTTISSLPNELLAWIFEEAASEPHGFTAVSKALSHVCKHWRLVALNLPSLWAEVELEQSHEERVACLERSRNAPLTVNISATDYCDVEELLDDIIPHAGRWRRLRFYIVDSDAREEFFSVVGVQYSKLDVPLLTDLKVDYSYARMEEMAEELGGQVVIFYSRWNMPNLRSLNVGGCLLPHRMLYSKTFGTNLIRCSLRLSLGSSRSDVFFACTDFLRRHNRLEEFRLWISCEREEREYSLAPVTLPNLRTLIIHLGRDMTDSRLSRNGMQHFMVALDMPCLSKLVLSLPDCRDDNLKEWINALLPKPYPNLEDLSLQVLPKHANRDFMEFLPDQTPNVRNLTLLTPTIPTLFTTMNLPHLRNIALMPCNVEQVADNLIKSTTEFIKHRGASYWDNFKGLEIVQHDIRRPQSMTEKAFQGYKLDILPSYHDLTRW